MLIRHFAERPSWGGLGSLLEAVRYRAVEYGRGRLCEDVESRTRLESNTAGTMHGQTAFRLQHTLLFQRLIRGARIDVALVIFDLFCLLGESNLLSTLSLELFGECHGFGDFGDSVKMFRVG